jgi:hypothetical protein
MEQAGGYDPAFSVAQDYDLWMRMSRVTLMANLPELLVVRRLLPGRVTAARHTERARAEASVRWRAVRSGAPAVVRALRSPSPARADFP